MVCADAAAPRLTAAAELPAAADRHDFGRQQERAQLARLLRDGEALLAAGDTDAAEQTFDRAALLAHAAETEIALMRAYMQGGGYRRAVAFGAHVAGAHREAHAASALYAWLLYLGGQAGPAESVLKSALAEATADPVLARVQLGLANASSRSVTFDDAQSPTPVLLAPYSLGAPVPTQAATVGTALLLGDGLHAWVPSETLGGASNVWLRNGLGQTVTAQMERGDIVAGLTLLRLGAPLPPAVGLRLAAAEPFAGSAGAVVEYFVSASAAAGWPVLRQGFFARATTDSANRPLGIDMPPGPRGGPVFDAAGRLVGMATAAPDGSNRLVTAAMLSALAGPLAAPLPATTSAKAAAAASTRPGADETYERALRIALQVLVLK